MLSWLVRCARHGRPEWRVRRRSGRWRGAARRSTPAGGPKAGCTSLLLPLWQVVVPLDQVRACAVSRPLTASDAVGRGAALRRLQAGAARSVVPRGTSCSGAQLCRATAAVQGRRPPLADRRPAAMPRGRAARNAWQLSVRSSMRRRRLARWPQGRGCSRDLRGAAPRHLSRGSHSSTGPAMFREPDWTGAPGHGHARRRCARLAAARRTCGGGGAAAAAAAAAHSTADSLRTWHREQHVPPCRRPSLKIPSSPPPHPIPPPPPRSGAAAATMVQRLTYRRRHCYNTASNRTRVVKTPGAQPGPRSPQPALAWARAAGAEPPTHA